MSVIHKPYDLLFKHTLGSDIALQDFVRYHLPKHLVDRIELASLKLTKQSFVPAELRELHSDLVCSCVIDGEETLLYLVIEHQSKESWLMPLRMIKYKVAAIEDFLQGKPEGTPWPSLLCACFYHGGKRPYPYPVNVYEYFENPSLAKEMGGFECFHLIDLTMTDTETMQDHGSLSLMEQILKHSRDEDFFTRLKDLLETYKDTLLSKESPLGSDYWHAVYLASQRILINLGYGEAAVADLFSKILNLSKNKEEIMSVTQAIRQEGREEGREEGMQQGIQQGRQEGRQEGLQQGMQQGMQQEKLGIARTMLQTGESIEKIARWTGLSEASLRSL